MLAQDAMDELLDGTIKKQIRKSIFPSETLRNGGSVYPLRDKGEGKGKPLRIVAAVEKMRGGF